MADDRIDVKIGATTGELKTGMDQSANLVKKGVAEMQSPFDRMRQSVTGGMQQMHSEVKTSLNGIGTVLNNIGKIALGVGAILAGGAIFKGAIDEYVKMNLEAKKLSVVMGVNIGDAQALLESFKRVGVEGDTITRALIVMTRQLKTNEEGFTSNGIATRDASGNLLSMDVIMFNAINRLKEMKEGTERMMLATLLFGRSVSDMPGFLKMTQEALEAMKKRLVDLGITLDDISAAKARAFQEGMSDVDLVMRSLKYKIGEELIPVLIQLAHFLADVGPPAIKAFGDAYRAAQDFMMRVGVIAVQLRDGFLQAWDQIKLGAETAWNVIRAVFSDNFASIGAAAAAGYAAMKQNSANWAQQAVRDANSVRDSILSAMQASPQKPDRPGIMGAGSAMAVSKAPEGDGDLFNPKTGSGTGGGSSLVQQWIQELEQMKAAEKKFQSQSLQMEKAFWGKKLAIGKVATQEELEALKSQEHQSEAMRLKAEADYWKGKLLLTGEGTKDYQEVQHKIVTLEQQQNKLRLQSEIDLIKSKIKAGQDAIKDKMALIEHENQLEKLNIEMKQSHIAHLAKMGAMSRMQELREYKKLKQEEHLADLKAAQDKAIADKGDLKAYQKHLKDIEILKKKQALEIKKIDFEITEAMKAQWGQVWNAVSQAFSMSVQGIITGTTTLADAIKNIWQSILTSLVGMFLQMALEYIAAKIMMLIFGEAADKEAAASEIGAQAGIAGAAGVASVMVALPFPANIAVAPSVGAAAAALAASFGILASAAGGWDVPADTLAMVHKDEKILPADWPEKLRAVAAPAGGNAGPSHLIARFPITVVTPDGRTILKENKTLFFDLTNQGISRGEIRIPAPAHR